MKKKDQSQAKPKALGVDDKELYDINCVNCRKNKVLAEGEFHCKFCGVMCENCSEKHQKTPKQTGHWAMKIKRIRQDYEPPHTFSSVRKCEIHPKRHIKEYCIDHGELVCKDCKNGRHFDCNVELIEVMSEDIKKDKDLVEARNELVDLKRRTKRTCDKKKEEIKKMAKRAEEFEQYMRKMKEKVMAIFDKMLVEILRDKDEFCKTESELIDKDVQKSHSFVPVLEAASKQLDDVYRSGSQTDIWISVKKLEHLMTYYDEIITNMENDRVDVKFEFIPNEHLTGLLEVSENIGKVKITSSRLHGNDTTLNGIHLESVPGKKSKFTLPWEKKDGLLQDPWKYKRIDSKSADVLPSVVSSNGNLKPTTGVKTSSPLGTPHQARALRSRHDFIDDPKKKVMGTVFGPAKNVKLTFLGRREIVVPTDTEACCITGSTFLPNGRLVLVDNHNKTLKLYNGDFEFLSILHIVERPWNVAHCYKSVVAVSYPYDNSVELITTGLEMKVESKLLTDRTCHGMAFHRTEKWLYIACGEGTDAQVQAYSLDGFLRKVIIPKAGVFHEPCYLAMSGDSRKLFVSDLDNGVIGFDTKSGDLICQYKDPKIKRYWDIKLDDEDKAFIITTDPDCIYVFMGDHNGQLVTEFRVGNKPCSLAYNPLKKALIVSRWKTNEVEVLRFV
ncbi:hypothetical protein ACF0H5_013746 [Mactra antiquata]